MLALGSDEALKAAAGTPKESWHNGETRSSLILVTTSWKDCR